MEPPEVPLEQVQEDIHHHAEHGGGHAAPPGAGHGAHPEVSWTRWVALSTACIAALAALAALAAGENETEAMQAKMSANDDWSYMQAASVKRHLVEDKIDILTALGHPPAAKLDQDRAKYEAKEKELQDQAKAEDAASAAYLIAHGRYGYGVTMFQVAIALSAISALTRRRRYWLLSLGLGIVGIAFALGGVAEQRSIQDPAASAASSPPEPTAQPEHAHAG